MHRQIGTQLGPTFGALGEEDLAREIRRYLGTPKPTNIGHIQIAGVPGRHEPDTGDLSFDPLFDLIDEFGYSGWIGLEYRPKAGTSHGLKWLRNRMGHSTKATIQG